MESKTHKALLFISKKGTARSAEIAEHVGCKQNSISALLEPYVRGGLLVTCLVAQPGRLPTSEYRMSAAAVGVSPQNFRDFRISHKKIKKSPVAPPRSEHLPNDHPRTAPIARGKLLSGEEALPLQKEASKEMCNKSTDRRKKSTPPAPKPAVQPQVTDKNSGSTSTESSFPPAVGRAVAKKPAPKAHRNSASGAGGHVPIKPPKDAPRFGYFDDGSVEIIDCGIVTVLDAASDRRLADFLMNCLISAEVNA